MSEKGGKKDKNQNIQVFVRLRPLNQRERDIKSLGVVDVCSNREVVVRHSHQTAHTKKFTFDKAFGPNATQVEVYKDVVSPLIEEVLAGYNCTVFAYGQTGTGKTHTMVGESSGIDNSWQNDPLSGIIPRSLSQLFDELRLTNTEYTVRVSYLELYNEELFDLLSTSDDNSKLRIYEDTTRKGSNIINGLEEITVYNKNEVYKIMAQGQERKRIASTLMNAQSSRSHTVFTIVIHMKENSPEGEELVKIGKLNLVDLAGSENISKAGSDNPAKRERARECVNINQSLLTLGRVITALVEKHPHIPYRESKLTRLLQESLGGRTKTSIIATISPGHKDLEETLSTLEYAHRAKNIQNKPEVNQKLTKKAVLKEYSEEIDRLKRDLQASREKNGVYLANETYAEITLKLEEQDKEIQEKLLQIKGMIEVKEKLEAMFTETLEEKENELKKTTQTLIHTKDVLKDTKHKLHTTKQQFEETAFIVETQAATEAVLGKQARQLLATADEAADHVIRLHNTVDKRKNVEQKNLQAKNGYVDSAQGHREKMQRTVSEATDGLIESIKALDDRLDSLHEDEIQRQNVQKCHLQSLMCKMDEAISEVKGLLSKCQENTAATVDKTNQDIRCKIAKQGDDLEVRLRHFLQQIAESVDEGRKADKEAMDTMKTFVEQWRHGSSERIESLRSAHAGWWDSWRENDDKLAELSASHAHLHQRYALAYRDMVNSQRMKMVEHKKRLEEEINTMMMDNESWLDSMLKHTQDEKVDADAELETVTELTNKQRALTKMHYKDMESDIAVIDADCQSFGTSIIEITEAHHEKTFNIVGETTECIRSQVDAVISGDRQSAREFSDHVSNMLLNVTETSKETIETTKDNIQVCSSQCTQELSFMSDQCTQLQEQAEACKLQRIEQIDNTKKQVKDLRENIGDDLAEYGVIQSQYLEEQYTTYSPTGKTPVRQDFRYPRMLASTSPRDRIIARFRAQQAAVTHNSDVEVVDCTAESESSASDSETSAAGDSAVIFVEPSPPPAPVSVPTPQQPRVFRSTSETELYTMKKGKENTREANLVDSQKKLTSKLRPPTSLRKVLTERN